jgi:exonuclease SbcD
MGHIHRHQALDSNPPMVYPGSIERVDFGERNEEKGCVLVELERGAARWRFHTLAARPFRSIELNVQGKSDPAAHVAQAIANHNVRDAVVRVQIRATQAEASLLRDEQIRQQLEAAQAFFVATIAIDIERETRTRFAGAEQELMQGLSPRRALHLYLQSRETEATHIETLLAAFDELQADDGEE